MEQATSNDLATIIERIAVAVGLLAMAIEKIIKAIKQNKTIQ